MIKKILKWIGLVFLALIVVMLVYAFLGKSQTLKLEIASVDLNRISDGVYSGSYDCFRWTNSVEVTVKDHKMTDIEPVNALAGREALISTLTERILSEQSPNVDAVTGATVDSHAFQKAVENSLESAITGS